MLRALRLVCDDEDFVVSHFRLFLGYTTGALLNETASMLTPEGFSALGADAPDGFVELATTCPALVAFGSALASCDFTDSYGRGVETVLDAIERAAQVG